MSLNHLTSFDLSSQSNLNIATNDLKIKCDNGDLLSLKPASKGNNGEALSSDGSGNVVWLTPSTGNMVYSQPSISASGSHYKASNTSGLLVDESSLVESNTLFDFQSKNLTTLGTLTSGAFIKQGGSNLNVLLADGTTAPYVTGSSSPNIYLYRNSTDITVPPSIISHIQYNDTIQQNATLIWINHKTDDNIDIDAFFSFITATDIIYIQDRANSLNYIKYNVVSTTQVLNDYIGIVVTYNFGEGTGLTTFGNNHPIFFSVFSNTSSINSRLALLENKTQYQSALVSNETLFTNLKATQIIKTPNNLNEYLMSDGSVIQGPYNIQSQGTGETLLNDGIGPTFKTKSLKVGTGLNISSTSNEITLTNSQPNNTTLSSVGSGNSLIPVTSVNPNFQVKSIQSGSGINIQNNSNDLTISNSEPASSITLTNIGTVNSILGSGVNPNFTTKGLLEGAGMQITINSTDLTITNLSPASGISLNTSGLGDSLINSATNPSFILKSLSVSGGLNLVPTSNNLLIQNTSPASSINLNAVGLGSSLIATSTNPNFNIKSIIPSTGINITNNPNDVTIINSSPASAINISSTAVGTSLLKTNANPTYTFKGLSAGPGITVTNQTDDLLISSTSTIIPESTGNTSRPILAFNSGNSSYSMTNIVAQGDGKIGIGTTAPTEKLTISSGNILMGGTHDGMLMNPGSGAGSFAITRSGNFINNVQQINPPYTDNVGSASGGGAQITLLKNEMSFSTYPNTGVLGTPITLTERMRITSTGVGIGTTTPSNKLDVRGITRITNDDGVSMFYVNWTNSIGTSPTILNALIASGGGYGELQTRGSIQTFYTNTTERMRIASDGNVGINTATPGEKLSIEGSGTANENVLRVNNQGNFASRIWLRNSGRSGYFSLGGSAVADTLATGILAGALSMGLAVNSAIQFFNGAVASVKMTILGDGNVGIGTTTPAYPLDVVGSAKMTTIRDTANSVGTAGQVLSSTGSALSWIAAPSSPVQMAIIRETQTTNVSSGVTYTDSPLSPVAQSKPRQFNVKTEAGLGITLSGGPNWTFTISTAGTYLFEATAMLSVPTSDGQTVTAKLLLNNTTLGLGSVIVGDSYRYGPVSAGQLTNSNFTHNMNGIYTITGVTVLRLDHVIVSQFFTPTGGKPSNITGYEEVYATLKITKLS